jgi:hypothetical protein
MKYVLIRKVCKQASFSSLAALFCWLSLSGCCCPEGLHLFCQLSLCKQVVKLHLVASLPPGNKELKGAKVLIVLN